MSVVDDLLAHPGRYLGIDEVADSDLRGAARIVVNPLPGGAGVTLDDDILNPVQPHRIRGHVEHTIVAHTHGGGTVMVIGHDHVGSVAILDRSPDPSPRAATLRADHAKPRFPRPRGTGTVGGCVLAGSSSPSRPWRSSPPAATSRTSTRRAPRPCDTGIRSTPWRRW